MAGLRVPISEHRLIDVIHRRLPESVLLLYMAAMAYVSLVPFDFERTPTFSANARYVGRLQLDTLNAPDLFANIGVYVPLGALAYMALRIQGRRTVTALVASLILAAGLSLGIEHVQVYTRSRVAAWPDFACNAVGGLLGAVVTAVWFGHFLRMRKRSREAARRNWWSAVAKGGVCVAMIAFLRPFDVAVDLPRTVLRALPLDLHPLAVWDSIPEKVERQTREGRLNTAFALDRYRAEYLLERASEIAVYAGLTVLLSFGGYLESRRRSSAHVRAAMVVISMSVLVTMIRLGLASHGFDAAHFYCALAGWLAGIIAAEVMVLRDRPQAESDDPPRAFDALPRGFAWCAMATALGLVALHELAPMDFGSAAGGVALSNPRLNWVPFKGHYLSRPNDALYDLSGEFLLYLVAGLCVANVVSRLRLGWRKQFALTVLLTAGLAGAFAAAHLTMASRHADVTSVVLAAFASATASIFARWMADYRRHLTQRSVDDPLTRQLIEGPAYRPVPVRAPYGSPRSDASRTDRAELRARD